MTIQALNQKKMVEEIYLTIKNYKKYLAILQNHDSFLYFNYVYSYYMNLNPPEAMLLQANRILKQQTFNQIKTNNYLSPLIFMIFLKI